MKGRCREAIEVLYRLGIELMPNSIVYIRYRIGFAPLSERFHMKTQKLYEAYQIGAFVKIVGQSDMKPIGCEMKTVSCKRGLKLKNFFSSQNWLRGIFSASLNS